MLSLEKGSLRSQLSYSVVVNAISIAINFLIQILIVRYFGVADFGRFAYWKNNIQLSSSLSLFGFNSASIRFLPQLLEPSLNKNLKKFLRTSYLLIALLATLCAVVIIWGVPNRLTDTRLMKALPTLASVLAMPLVIVMSSQLRIIGSLKRAIFLERLGYQSLFLLSIIGLIYLTAIRSPLSLAQTFSAALCLTLVIISAYLWRALEKRNQLKKMTQHNVVVQAPSWGKSIPIFFFLAVGNTINLRIGIFVVGAMLSAKATGQFAFMQALAGIATFPLFSFNQIVGPRISVLNTQNNIAAIKPLVGRVQILSLFIGAFLAVAIYLATPIISWMTTELNVVVPIVFIVLLLATIVNAGFGPVGTALAMVGGEKYAARYTLAAAIIKVPLLFLLISKFGLIGAAIGELVTILLWNLAMQFRLYKILSQKMVKT